MGPIPDCRDCEVLTKTFVRIMSFNNKSFFILLPHYLYFLFQTSESYSLSPGNQSFTAKTMCYIIYMSPVQVQVDFVRPFSTKYKQTVLQTNIFKVIRTCFA